MRYYGDVYRPPSEAYSLIIQVTLGCSQNTCAFCGMYKDKSFYSRPLKDVLRDLEEVAAAGYSYRASRIFLADGDALVRDTDELIEILDACYTLYPVCRRVTSYASPRSLLLKSDEDLKKIHAHGLEMVYLGLESGSNEVLKYMRKGYTAAQICEAGLKAKRSGMKLSVTAISGLGGKAMMREHIEGTADILSKMVPDYLGLLTLGVCEGTLLYDWIARGEFKLLSSDEVLHETREILERMDCPGCVFRMNHASNYLNLAGTLNGDRQKLIDKIDAALGGKITLKPEWMRGL